MPASADSCLHSVWRPLRGPVEEWPLATMDGRSLKEGHVHPTNIFKHQYSLQGQTVSISYSPEQRWFYLDRQNTDEVTFIKIWDNKDDVESKRELKKPSIHISDDKFRPLTPRRSLRPLRFPPS